MQYRSRPHYLHNPSVVTPEITEIEESFLAKWLPTHNPAEKSQLYHYTTLNGMQGILNDRSLWLGHIGCLNDRLEIQYGQTTMREVLQDAVERETSEPLRVFIRNILIHIQAFANNSLHHTFVGCFCESGNLLSQWRGYAHRGEGYCLGFEFSSATRIVSDIKKLDAGMEPYLRKVIYDEKLQRALVQDYLSGVLGAAKRGLSSGRNPFPDDSTYAAVMAIQAAGILLDMLLCFKHPAFESENEWRLVRVTADDYEPEGLKFREATGELIPYRPMHIYDQEDKKEPSFPLRSIGFGPMLEPGRTRSTIQLLLHHIAADQHSIKLTPHLQIYGAGYSLRKD
jgi:hypothetical protein